MMRVLVEQLGEFCSFFQEMNALLLPRLFGRITSTFPPSGKFTKGR